MAQFSFDIVSTYDKAEVNNALAAMQKEILSRYDFKGTPANIDWMGDKAGLTIVGSNEWQVDALIDIAKKHLINRGQSPKILDLTGKVNEANLKATKQVPFIDGLDQTKAKKITSLLREEFPKVKAQIQGDAVRVMSPKKDELQSVMQFIKSQDLDFATSFTNYR